ncbi:MAG: TIR domain-containing protein [Bacteroidota bacterium]
MSASKHLKKPVQIFYSYAHEDRKNRATLSKYLAPMQDEKVINEWFDDNIIAGEVFGGVINKNLYAADIIILIISTDFVNSRYCWTIEMPDPVESTGGC